MIEVGLVSAVSLGLTNICLDKYVKRNPTSRLARDMDDGCNRRLYHYAVPILSMSLGLSLWVTSLLSTLLENTMQDWWFGVRRQWASSWIMGLAAGHYAQDIVANQWCGMVLFVHHVAAVAHAFCLQAASSWSGLLTSWSGVYEAGSFLLCLGYTGVVSRHVGHMAATLSSVIGMALGLHGLIVKWPLHELNGPAWFSVIALVGLGVGRIQDGVGNLRQMKRAEKHA